MMSVRRYSIQQYQSCTKSIQGGHFKKIRDQIKGSITTLLEVGIKISTSSKMLKDEITWIEIMRRTVQKARGKINALN